MTNVIQMLLLFAGCCLVSKIAYCICGMGERRCESCGSILVYRIHKIVPFCRCRGRSRTDCACFRCGEMRELKDWHDRDFSNASWIWRKLLYRRQFRHIEGDLISDAYVYTRTGALFFTRLHELKKQQATHIHVDPPPAVMAFKKAR